VCPHPPIRKVTLCYVTDRRVLADSAEDQIRLLLEKIAVVARAGVDWIQVREKDLSARALANLAERAMARVPRPCRILLNDRLDVAIAAGAGGVHLGETSIAVEQAKRLVTEKKIGSDFLVGVSTHSRESAEAAERSGANYIIFGPVYETPSKMKFGAPQGVKRLAEVCAQVSIPVIAIGGVTEQNAMDCIAAGASGIAAIRMFQEGRDLSTLVRQLRHE
jgi:thiamine-phosphate pyrophosphorylase